MNGSFIERKRASTTDGTDRIIENVSIIGIPGITQWQQSNTTRIHAVVSPQTLAKALTSASSVHSLMEHIRRNFSFSALLHVSSTSDE
jgi:hypothetical protein